MREVSTEQAEERVRGVRAALSGLRVLDLSRFIAGPHCAMLLGDLGADVVKVETVGKGEHTRSFHPRLGDESVYTMIFNRNKRGMTLNFRSPDGQEVLRALIQNADVVIENFVPGTLEKMGCGWEEMQEQNPRLIMTRISGFGSSGPYANRPCFDVIAQAMSGLMDLTGQRNGPPTMAGTFIADYSTALYAAIGTLGAIQSRERTGKGQLVEVALIDSALSLLFTAIPEQILFGRTTTRNGNRDRFVAPSNTFQTREGAWILFQASGEERFRQFAAAIGRPDLADDPRFATNELRLINVEELEQAIAAWASTVEAGEALAILEAAALPCAKVATIAEVVDNPQVAQRGQILWVEQAGGKVPMHGFAVQLGETPMALRHPAPSIGEHTDSIIEEWLGYSAADIGRLRTHGAI